MVSKIFFFTAKIEHNKFVYKEAKMAYFDFIKDLLNVVIQHSESLFKTLELVTKWVVLLMSLIILVSVVLALAVFRSSKYEAKHSVQKTEVSVVLLISALDLVINAISLLQGH